jgi:hypothetical protein
LKVASGTKQFKFNTFGSSNNNTSSPYTATSEWQRFEYTFTAVGSGSTGIYPAIVDGLASATFFIWGFQLNIGSTAKPYFPTTDQLNVPRLTYQNGGGGCPSLLLEKQSTNLALYSEDFASGWTQANITVTANNTTSPDGTQNADKIEASGSGSVSHSVRQFISTTSGAVYALSLYAKKGTADWIMIRHDNGGTLNYFNLNTGAKGTADASATITSVGNGWYRIVVYHTGTGSNGPEIYIATSDGGNEFTANGQNIYIWGAQYEASSYPTSYIPTTSASATRVADYTSRSGLALTNFTFAVNFKPLAYVVELFDFEKTGGGRMFYVAVQSNGFITFNSVSGGTIGAIGSVLTINQTCKLAFKLNASTSALTVFINGSNIGTYTTNITTFGAFFGLQSFGYNPGTQIEQIAIFPSVLTDAECISLTS